MSDNPSATVGDAKIFAATGGAMAVSNYSSELEALLEVVSVPLDLPTFSAIYARLETATRLTTAAKVLLVARALEQGLSESDVFDAIVDHVVYYGVDGHAATYGYTRAREILVVAKQLGSATLIEVMRRGGMNFEQLRELAYIQDENTRASLINAEEVYHLPAVEIGARAREMTIYEFTMKRVLLKLRRAIERAKRYDVDAREICRILRECGYEIC